MRIVNLGEDGKRLAAQESPLECRNSAQPLPDYLVRLKDETGARCARDQYVGDVQRAFRKVRNLNVARLDAGDASRLMRGYTDGVGARRELQAAEERQRVAFQPYVTVITDEGTFEGSGSEAEGITVDLSSVESAR